MKFNSFANAQIRLLAAGDSFVQKVKLTLSGTRHATVLSSYFPSTFLVLSKDLSSTLPILLVFPDISTVLSATFSVLSWFSSGTCLQIFWCLCVTSLFNSYTFLLLSW